MPSTTRMSRVLVGTTLGGILWVSTVGAASPQPNSDAVITEEAAHLATFDDLDFNVFSGQKWAELGRSHGKDIVVHWPDGRTTRGIAQHIDDLKSFFAFAPDSRIEEHPIKVASGEWTAVTSVFQGTFTKPMPVEGETIPPTGKPFKLSVATIGHWTDGVMDEEWLFWDNQTFMKQLGLAQ